MNGVLIVDKPSGPTSHDVVARVRKTIGLRRIGHTGTLDPLATGVLPLVLGRATRLSQFLSADEKEYVADVRLGASSDTYDAMGRLSRTLWIEAGASDRWPTAAGVESVLSEFRGTYWQTPPPFSAKKIAGTPAYRFARRDQAVELKPVSVTVSALTLVACSHDVVRLRVVCSAGFYVRTLAHELGVRLGCGGYLEALRRTRVGSFREEEAVPLETIEQAGTDALRYLLPMNRLLEEYPTVVVNPRGLKRATHGNALGPEDLAGPPPAASTPKARVVDSDGSLLAIAEPVSGGLLHPVVVLV
ncbi:MAG: tRNA pseudouridine(55) synthase TruB [Vicinamibacterales bacterium]|jgi:tRNA pseudouridine55 synthase